MDTIMKQKESTKESVQYNTQTTWQHSSGLFEHQYHQISLVILRDEVFEWPYSP
jgi:hypothetical protein